MKRYLIIALAALACLAAASAQTSLPARPEVMRIHLDGSSNLKYQCFANQIQTAKVWTVGDGLTSIAISSNVGTVTAAGHGLYQGARVTVASSGVSALNGTYTVATVPTADTFTIATSGVGDSTVTAAGMTVTTTYPRENAEQWAIKVYEYSGTTLLGSRWASKPAATGEQAAGLKCSERATY